MVGITAEIRKWRQGQPAPLIAFDATGVSRSLTTAMTDDPDLSLTLEPGTWKFEWRTRWSRGLGAAAVTAKFNFNTSVAFPLSTVGYGDLNGLYASDFNRLIDNTAADTTQIQAIGVTVGFSGQGYGTILTETTVTLEWAQLASSATLLNRLGGSFFMATKIG